MNQNIDFKNLFNMKTRSIHRTEANLTQQTFGQILNWNTKILKNTGIPKVANGCKIFPY